MEKNVNTANILLVEDSEADVELVQFCLNKNKVHVNLKVIENGQEAVDYLFDPSCELPDIILLDINLPGKNGIEILHEIKANTDTCFIPVIMLTSSKHDEDVIKSYSNHANCFLQKPLELESFKKIIDNFEQFWLSIVTLPKDARVR